MRPLPGRNPYAFRRRHSVVRLMPSRRAASASRPPVRCSVSTIAWRSRSASVRGASACDRNTTSPRLVPPERSGVTRPPNATSRSRSASARCAAASSSISASRRADSFAYTSRPYASNSTTPSLSDSITALPRGETEWGGGSVVVLSLGAIYLSGYSTWSSRFHSVAVSLGDPTRRADVTGPRALSAGAPPLAAAHQPLAIRAGQARQLPVQLRQRIGAHRFPFTTLHDEPDRPVQLGEVALPQASRLSLFQSYAHHPPARLHFVLERDPIAVQVDRRGQRVEARTLGRGNGGFHVQREARVEELLPRADLLQPLREPRGNRRRGGVRQLPPRAPPVQAEPVERLAQPAGLRVRRGAGEQRVHQGGARRARELRGKRGGQRLDFPLQHESEVGHRADQEQARVTAPCLEHDLGRAAVGVAADPALRELGPFDARARDAETVGEVSQRSSHRSPAPAYRPAAYPCLAGVRRLFVDHQVT